MEKPLTVVLSDESILPEVCGANDSNLKVFEELLGVRIFSHGNEILLETRDDSIERTFTSMLHQVEDHIRLGQYPGADLIRSIHRSIKEGEPQKAEILKRSTVVIPRGFRKVHPRTYNQAEYLRAMEKDVGVEKHQL